MVLQNLLSCRYHVGLAETTAGQKVTVNVILPGPTFTPGVHQYVADMAKKSGKTEKEVEVDSLKR